MSMRSAAEIPGLVNTKATKAYASLIRLSLFALGETDLLQDHSGNVVPGPHSPRVGIPSMHQYDRRHGLKAYVPSSEEGPSHCDWPQDCLGRKGIAREPPMNFHEYPLKTESCQEANPGLNEKSAER